MERLDSIWIREKNKQLMYIYFFVGMVIFSKRKEKKKFRKSRHRGRGSSRRNNNNNKIIRGGVGKFRKHMKVNKINGYVLYVIHSVNNNNTYTIIPHYSQHGINHTPEIVTEEKLTRIVDDPYEIGHYVYFTDEKPYQIINKNNNNNNETYNIQSLIDNSIQNDKSKDDLIRIDEGNPYYSYKIGGLVYYYIDKKYNIFQIIDRDYDFTNYIRYKIKSIYDNNVIIDVLETSLFKFNIDDLVTYQNNNYKIIKINNENENKFNITFDIQNIENELKQNNINDLYLSNLNENDIVYSDDYYYIKDKEQIYIKYKITKINDDGTVDATIDKNNDVLENKKILNSNGNSQQHLSSIRNIIKPRPYFKYFINLRKRVKKILNKPL